MLKHAIPYALDSSALFERIAHLPWPMFLDSGKPESEYGRFDILVAQPFVTIISDEAGTNGIKTEIRHNSQLTVTQEDGLTALKRLLAGYTVKESSGLPFAGGALGYFSYDLSRQIECLPRSLLEATELPHMQIGFYDWAVVVDHQEKTAQLVSHGLVPATHENWAALCLLFDRNPPAHDADTQADFSLSSALTSNMNYSQYSVAFNKIKDYIMGGDCYQVNLALRFAAKATGDSWIAYKKLRELSPAPFMAYMKFPRWQLLSGSPERFLQLHKQLVETRPIKGTRPRSLDADEDASLALDLQGSTKDQAENLMIVDLLRNDIGKSCEIGSVKADQLFRLQSFANVHHLVSIVTGRLAQGKTAIDLLRGCFPGGSITGAPKLRAMQIIDELEPHRRGVYCGAVAYIGFDGNMDSSIAIRTAIYREHSHAEGEISFYAGGGIVSDSELALEYAEIQDKASSLLKTMRHFLRLNQAAS
ncbi:MAG: aminodeoxychorismate synthase component I [Methylotenera sp.]|nr:aminodeoxychorismate synthase component I [Methylotenera sp.]